MKGSLNFFLFKEKVLQKDKKALRFTRFGELHRNFEPHHVGYPRTQGAWNLADATRYRIPTFSLWLSLAEIKFINAATSAQAAGASHCPTYSFVLPSVGATCDRPCPIAKIVS